MTDTRISQLGAAAAPASDWPKQRISFDGCPLCGSRNSYTLRTANCTAHPLYHPIVDPTMTWMQCSDCSHVYTDGYFSNEVAQVVFQRTHDSQSPGWDFEQQRMISARIIERVAGFVGAGVWLDVGFGNGSLLFTAEEWGFTPFGIDLRQQSVTAMRHLGIEARCVDLTALEEPQRFSVISLADVLEHMPFPREGLAAAKRLLRPDGVLFVSMPNYNCAAWRLLDRANSNPYWGELEHFHNFSRMRLHALLREMGFEPMHYAISERYRLCMEIVARHTGPRAPTVTYRTTGFS
jgi:SAM-dependent methyltransferase